MNNIQRAAMMAEDFHRGQRDKIGREYFAAHVEPVAQMVRDWGGTEYQVTAGYLHDLVEDTLVTPDYLRGEFPDEVVTIVEYLTKPNGMPYDEFIHNVVKWQPAVLVKIADITSNLDPARMFYLEPDKRTRLVAKYTNALPVLWQHYQGR